MNEFILQVVGVVVLARRPQVPFLIKVSLEGPVDAGD